MQFTVTAAAFLALIGSAMAQIAGFDAISAPADGEVITADGKTATTITWDPSADYNGQMVSILLLQGATEATLDFYPGDNVASSIDSALGTYEWTPQASIAGFATYGLKLQLDSDPTIFQYSFPFKIAAGSSSSSDDTTTTTTTSSAAAVTTTTVAKNNNNAVPSDVSSTSTTISSTAAAVTSSSSSNSSDADSSSAGTTAAQTTLATATAATATGSSSSPVVTAGAARVVAGGLAAVGGVMAVLVL